MNLTDRLHATSVFLISQNPRTCLEPVATKRSAVWHDAGVLNGGSCPEWTRNNPPGSAVRGARS